MLHIVNKGRRREEPLGLSSAEVLWTNALELPDPNSSDGLFLETPIFQVDLFITPAAKYNRSWWEVNSRDGSLWDVPVGANRMQRHLHLVLVSTTILSVFLFIITVSNLCASISIITTRNMRLFVYAELLSCQGFLAGVWHSFSSTWKTVISFRF